MTNVTISSSTFCLRVGTRMVNQSFTRLFNLAFGPLAQSLALLRYTLARQFDLARGVIDRPAWLKLS